MDSLAETTKNQVVLKEEEEEEEEHFSYAMQLVTSAGLPMMLLAAIRLNVFEIIARAGPGAQLSPSEIAANVSSENPNAAAMLDRMLRLLASYSVLTCSVATDVDGDHAIQTPTRVYGLAPVGQVLCTEQNKGRRFTKLLLALLQDKVFIDVPGPKAIHYPKKLH
nr:caffeic acid 3-O-methyltransferase-like [Coffea arabica]